MMEHTTDRLFWTLTSIIVGALILTIGINAFPKATQGVIQPISGVLKQADNAGKTANATGSQAASDAANFSVSDSNSQSTDPDAQAKANAPVITDNANNQVPSATYDAMYHKSIGSDGVEYQQYMTNDSNNTVSINIIRFQSNFQGTSYTIPEYLNIDSKLYKVTSINGDSNFLLAGNTSNINSITIPKTVQSIDGSAFAYGWSAPFANGLQPNITINLPKGIQDVNNAYGNGPITKHNSDNSVSTFTLNYY